MSICIVNYSNPLNVETEYDHYVDYKDGIFYNAEKILKKCWSWHSLAASLQTEFCVVGKSNFEKCYKYDTIILLIHRDLEITNTFVDKLKLMKKKILVSFHENVDELVNLSSMNLTWLKQFVILCNKCDVFLNMNSSFDPFFEALLKIPIERIHHAVPYEWSNKLIKPFETREGILIGTRTFNQRLRRNTLVSLSLCNKVAQKKNTFATLLTEDGIYENYFKEIGMDNIKVEQGPLNYVKWLELISKHKLMIHFDTSNTLGQVAADAAQVGVVCLGGNSENNKLLGTHCTDYWWLETDAIRWLNYNEKVYQDTIKDLKEFTTFEAVKKEIMEIVEKL